MVDTWDPQIMDVAIEQDNRESVGWATPARPGRCDPGKRFNEATRVARESAHRRRSRRYGGPMSRSKLRSSRSSPLAAGAPSAQQCEAHPTPTPAQRAWPRERGHPTLRKLRELTKQFVAHDAGAGDGHRPAQTVGNGRFGIDAQQVQDRGQDVLGRNRRFGHVRAQPIAAATTRPRAIPPRPARSNKPATSDRGRRPATLAMRGERPCSLIQITSVSSSSPRASRSRISPEYARSKAGNSRSLSRGKVLPVRIPVGIQESVFVPKDRDKLAAGFHQPPGCQARLAKQRQPVALANRVRLLANVERLRPACAK